MCGRHAAVAAYWLHLVRLPPQTNRKGSNIVWINHPESMAQGGAGEIRVRERLCRSEQVGSWVFSFQLQIEFWWNRFHYLDTGQHVFYRRSRQAGILNEDFLQRLQLAKLSRQTCEV